MLTEETSCTVLHRLIQEQLRYGNPTDAHTLLAIQQQALRSGGNGGVGSSRSSSDSLSQEERQEPQGQEHHADIHDAESYQLYHQHHHEQLPTYEQAKANAQLLASYWYQDGQICAADDKRSHARSLSERLMRLSLQHKDKAEVLDTNSLCSYSQIADYQLQQHTQMGYQPHQEVENIYQRSPPPFHSQHNRITPPVQTPEARHVFCPSRGVSAQTELLMKENERLKRELQGHEEKTCRVHKLEQEIQRVSEAYNTLMQGCVKKEELEQALRSKLIAEVKRLQDSNAELRESLESQSKQAAKDIEAADQHQNIIAKLLVQKEEQQLHCARLEHEAQLLREESNSAQTRNLQLQAELNRKTAYVERVGRLQGALAQLQATCEKRESLELRLRTRLEQELRMLRNQQRQTQSSPATIQASSANTVMLLERLREREERLLALEADSTRWEQKYLEEKTMREFAMEAAATAAAQRDTTIINHSPCHSSKTSFSEDISHADLRSQEVENRIRALYGQIMEKDAVINVLQQRLQHEQDRGEPGGDVSSSCTSLSETDLSQGKAPSHTDEQTSGLSRPAAVCRARGQAEHVTHLPATSSLDTNQKAVDPFKGLDNVKPEAVEIFI